MLVHRIVRLVPVVALSCLTLVAVPSTGEAQFGKRLADTQPVADNTSPEGRANNRRVELVKQ